MQGIGYIRISTDKQDAQKQRHLLLNYAQQHKLLIDEFIAVEISSRKNTKERRIDEPRAKLADGDTIIVAELSRLGRNMFETLNIINTLGESGVRIIFVRQPELSTTGPHTKLPTGPWPAPSTATSPRRSGSYSRCAQPKAGPSQGLTAARARGKKLGRSKGRRNKVRVLDPYKDQIGRYRALGLDLAAIRKLINPQLERPLSYQAYRYFLQSENRLTDPL